jgi:filamentous hemagglutinin family protein
MDTKGLFKKVVNLVILSSFLLWNFAVAVPEGGSVAQGSVQISQAGAQTTINQTSQNTVINWHGFDTAATESVKFNQPNSSSIALNRINSGQPTNFNGSLSANGQVWLLNPSGVLFGSTSKIDVAGLLVTTHNITDADFMSGNYQFTLDSNSLNSKIINNGLISAKDSGIVALVAPWVENNGVITANLGKVYLSSGSAFVLDMYGDSLINFGSSPAVQNGYVSNSGLIEATGGKVHMTANAAAGVLNNVISMSGVIEAKTATTGKHGEIILNSYHSTGKVKVTGKLDVSNGGFVETSGVDVDVADSTIVTGGGTWLLDPPDLILDSTTLPFINFVQNQLNSGTNIILETVVSPFNAPTGVGDIYLNTPLVWTGTAKLTFSAYHDILINSTITNTGGGALVLRADNTGIGLGTVILTNNINVASPGTVDVYYNPTVFPIPTSFSPYLNGSATHIEYMLVNYSGSVFCSSFPTCRGFNDIALNPSGNYALAKDIFGFVDPVIAIPFFSGILDGYSGIGSNHRIGFVTNTGGAFIGGLVNSNSGIIRNLTLSVFNIGTVGGGSVVGGVAAINAASGVISNVHVDSIFGPSAVKGISTVGGIVGNNQGLISNVSFYGAVTAGGAPSPTFIGGIAGSNSGTGTIEKAYVTGSVTATGFSFAQQVGGIVGDNTGIVRDVYNNANVTATQVVGGIAGDNFGGSITNVYNRGVISGTSSGAIVGANVVGPVTGAFYLIPSVLPACGSGVCSATGLTDPQLKVQANFPGFNFSTIWTTAGNSTYPFFQTTAAPIFWTVIGGHLLDTNGGALTGLSSNNIYLYYNNSPVVSPIGSPQLNDSNGNYFFLFDPAGFNGESSANNYYVESPSGMVIGGTAAQSLLGTTTNFDIYANTVIFESVLSVVPNLGLGIFSNSYLGTSLTSATLFSVDGSNDLILNPGMSLDVKPTVQYFLDGNITASSGGNITFENYTTAVSGYLIPTPNYFISTDTGNITLGQTDQSDGSEVPYSGVNLTLQTTTGNIILNGPVSSFGGFDTRNLATLSAIAGGSIYLNNYIQVTPDSAVTSILLVSGAGFINPPNTIFQNNYVGEALDPGIGRFLVWSINQSGLGENKGVGQSYDFVQLNSFYGITPEPLFSMGNGFLYQIDVPYVPPAPSIILTDAASVQFFNKYLLPTCSATGCGRLIIIVIQHDCEYSDIASADEVYGMKLTNKDQVVKYLCSSKQK